MILKRAGARTQPCSAPLETADGSDASRSRELEQLKFTKAIVEVLHIVPAFKILDFFSFAAQLGLVFSYRHSYNICPCSSLKESLCVSWLKAPDIPRLCVGFVAVVVFCTLSYGALCMLLQHHGCPAMWIIGVCQGRQQRTASCYFSSVC